MFYNVNLRENFLCQPIVGKRGESCRCCCHLRELCELWCLQINLFKVISFKTIFWLIDSFLAPHFGFYNLIRSLSPFFSLQRPGPYLLSWQLSPNDDENDALLGGQAQMTDEERFKVGITVNIFPPRGDQSQNSTKFPNLILLNDENQIAAYENTEEVSFE